MRLAVFEQLGKMLGRNPVASKVEVKDLLDVVKPLMRFVRKLNDFAKQTKAFAPITLAVRAAIIDASEPDMLLFRDLPAACGVDSFTGKSSDRSADVEKFLRALQAALSEIQRGYDLLLQNLGTELASALAADATERDRRKLLCARAAMVRCCRAQSGCEGIHGPSHRWRARGFHLDRADSGLPCQQTSEHLA